MPINREIRLRHREWFIMCRPSRRVGQFVAYGAHVQLPDQPILLPRVIDLYFDFAESANEAITALKKELDKVDAVLSGDQEIP